MSRSPKLFVTLLMLFVFLALPLLACETLTGGDEPEVEEVGSTGEEVVPGTAGETAEDEQAEAPSPTEPPPATDPPPVEEAEPTAVPEVEVALPVGPLGMGRDNPYPIEELVEAPNWNIQVQEVVRGDAAWDMVLAENEYNDPPPEGMEYVVVKVYGQSTYEDDEPHEISYFDFDVTGERFLRYETAFVVDPEPALSAELASGGETEGWMTFPVGIGEGKLVLIFDEWANFDDDNERYIALEEGAAVAIPASLLDVTPTDVGLSRDNAAALGETAVTERWEMTVLDVVRGAEAEALIMEVDEYNDPPEEGFEYVAIKMRGHNVSTEEEAEWLSSDNFTIVGELNEVHENPWITPPNPPLDADTYPGAEIEGWVTMQAAEGEGGLVLIFESYHDYSDEGKRYFALDEGGGAQTTGPATDDDAAPKSDPAGADDSLGMWLDNPVPYSEIAQAPNWDIQVQEVIRGDAAWDMVLEAFDGNDPPPEGMEYVVVKIYAKSTYEDDEPHEITYFDFDIMGDRLIRNSTAFVSDPEPELSAELYTGGDTEGWVTFAVGIGEGNLMLIFDEWANFDEDNERYIALEEGATLVIPAGLEEIAATDVGLTRENPAAIGEATVSDRWEMTLLEVVRGEAATAMINEAYDYNDPPEEGYEFILARVRARNVNTDEESEYLDSNTFTVVGELNEFYENPYFTTPDPELAYEIYPGGEAEGWVALQAAEGEGGLVMAFESYYDWSGEGQRFFTLE